MELYINNEADVYAAKITVSCTYKKVNINTKKLKYKGLMRHALIYALNIVETNGLILINDEPFKTELIKSNKIDFWQIRQEVFKALKNNIETIEVNNKTGVIQVKKINHPYSYDGISFGVVFSGAQNEEPTLYSCIDSIINSELTGVKYEIMVCGPSNYNSLFLLDKYKDYNLRYLIKDMSTTKRIMICEKKNYLFSAAKYNLAVICHARINFEKIFPSKILGSVVEMSTTAVYFNKNGKEHKYLDLAFIGKYEDLMYGSNVKPTVAAGMINQKYLHWYKRMVPFIDGALNIFNKNIIELPPYNDHIAWGEAEDIDVCNNLYCKGVLIDYIPDIKSYSTTLKMSLNTNFIKKTYRLYKKALVKYN